MKKIFGLLVILLVVATGTTCKKKIKKYPFDMYGEWYSEDVFCGKFLTIEKSGNGKMYSAEGTFCTNYDKDVKGKVKYKRDFLYIGKKKFEIFDLPKTITSNDSIEVPVESSASFETKKYKVLASMKLQPKGIFELEGTYTFYKIVDY